MNSNFKFLIIGAGRGGTSLIMALLDYHSKLELISEYKSIEYLMGKALSEQNSPNMINNRINKFTQACRTKASHHPNLQWGNKITTEQLRGLNNNVDIPKNNDEIFDMFFNQQLIEQKKIFILRDGRNCVISKVNRTNKSMQEACEAWNYSVEVYKYLQTSTNTLTIKFEDLINSPILTLISISKFLDITFEENMLKGVSNKKLSLDYQNSSIIKDKAIPPEIDKQYLQLIESNLKYCDYI